jgi:eukaryotic-like serine/threonine-protein kinase
VKRIKRIILEVHRRSLWQVLSIYLVGSWVTMQVVQAITVSAGLPDWVPGFALVLLLVGLPIVLATAFVQEGRPAGRHASPDMPAGTARPRPDSPTTPADPLRLLTWRNAILGGVLAFALLGVAATVFTGMRTLGIGPVATLRAQGVFEEGERIILADFANATPDPLLGNVVTTALRVDLHQSPALVLLEPTEIARVLQRMQRETEAGLGVQTALEIAEREGVKAVLEGEVGALGTGFVVTATLRGARDGHSLAAFRVTARSADDLIPAIDQLSRQIREKAGESLRTVRAGPPLVHVTTSSLPALRKLTEANVAASQGDFASAIPLIREAVAMDTAFAMAWRYLGVVLSNSRIDPAGQIDAYTRAHRHSDRLTERERYLAAAAYHSWVTGDRARTIEAYRSVLRLDPDDPTALNNLGNLYAEMEQFDEAHVLYRRAAQHRDRQASALHNLVFNSLSRSRIDEARAATAEFERAFPSDPRVLDGAAWTEWAAGDLDAAETLARRIADSVHLGPLPRVYAQAHLAMYAQERGQYRRARDHMDRYADGLEASSPGSGLAPRLVMLERGVLFGDDPERLLRTADEAVAGDTWRSLPAQARPYGMLVQGYAAMGAADRVRHHLAELEDAVPAGMRGSDYERDRLAWLGILALRQGDPAEAARKIEEARGMGGCQRCYRSYLAEAYELLGQVDDAIALHESALAAIHPFPPTAILERVVAMERLGPLYEARGDYARAIEAYARFADRWRDADPALQPRVESATRAIARLRDPG